MRTLASVLVWIGCLGFALAAPAETKPSPLLELHVKNVVYLRQSRSPVVVLVDREEKHFLPIWIGFAEAQAIAMELYEITPPRPMTHDLIRNLVKELDGTVDQLVITEIKANTYHANLSVTARGKTKSIDCRPSDGIAIALRTRSPILAAEQVMKNALPLPEEAAGGGADAQALPALDVTAQTLTPDLAEAFGLGRVRGVLVTESRRKELQRGDVIAAVDDAAVATVAELKTALEKTAPAKKVSLRILRDGQASRMEVPLRAGKR